MEHQNLEKMTSTALMLPREEKEKVIIISPNNGVGKILIREDTILANLQGCAGCGRAQFACAGVKEKWSVLCWGRKQSDKKYYSLLVILSATFVLSLIGTVMFCCTNTLNDAILSNMVIRNNSMAFKFWRRPNVQPLMKVHIFNYTNWKKVESGDEEKLHVEDVGPYVYEQQLERVKIKFEGDQLSYQEKNIFRYVPEKSTGVHFDQVVVPNLPLLGVMSKASEMNLNTFGQISLNGALTFVNHPHAFIQLPVHRFLWGYDDNIISVAKPLLSLQGQLKFDNFGLLVTKNGTETDRFTINTGASDLKRMNMIEKFNGDSQLPYWGSDECNSIDASDGSIFPPSLLANKSPLQVFFPNLCRRLPFFYEKTVEISDEIQLYRYKMPIEVFSSPDLNPRNLCYCEVDTGLCPPSGVINVTNCAMGAPALASFPHFFRGDPKLQQEISGLKPDPALHDSFVDIHPTLGISLHGKSCLQINMQVRKLPAISALKFLKNGLILPVAWIEMSVEELPESLRTLVYHGTYSTAAAQLGLIVSSVISLLVSGTCLAILILQRRRKPCVTIKKVAETELMRISS